MKQVWRCPPLRYGAVLSSVAMSASTISMVLRCQVSRFQSPHSFERTFMWPDVFRVKAEEIDACNPETSRGILLD